MLSVAEVTGLESQFLGQKNPLQKQAIAVPTRDTSQNCSNCGHNVAKTLSTRTHKCPHCGYVADRDENAAINILRKATTVGQTGSNA